MTDRQDTVRGDDVRGVPPTPAVGAVREPVTHSLKGSIMIDLDTVPKEEDDG